LVGVDLVRGLGVLHQIKEILPLNYGVLAVGVVIEPDLQLDMLAAALL
jgi:hypothetical protein